MDGLVNRVGVGDGVVDGVVGDRRGAGEVGVATAAMRAGTLSRGRVVGSVDELLADATTRAGFAPSERRSGSAFERVWIDGAPHIVKYVHLDDDCTMRSSGDLGCRPLRAYAAGLLDVAPAAIDHATVGAAPGHGRNGWGGALLMRDLSDELVPAGDDPFGEEQHARFLDHLAAMCARTWGWTDELDLLGPGRRWEFFGGVALEAEQRLGWPEPVPRIAMEGWERFFAIAPPSVAAGLAALHRDVAPLVEALARTPQCLLHGDWKASNLGTAADGRTVLIDWAYIGAGPAAHELGWYLALNRAKVPRGRGHEQAVDDFAAALRRHGVDLAGWWERQVALCLLGTLVQFGWEKALMAADARGEQELAWWCDRAAEGLRRL